MLSPETIPVERFEELFAGDPQTIEQRLVALRLPATSHPDLSLLPQIESQIALVQAMQGRIDEALVTLDRAEQTPGARIPVAQIRLWLERGRVYHQARRMSEAFPWMLAAYRLSLVEGHDFHTINAAHLLAIVAHDASVKILWNRIAVELADVTRDDKARAWRGVLQNNLGQAYLAAGRFESANHAFTKCREFAALEQNSLLDRGGRWGIAKSLRALGQTNQALAMQHELLREYDELEPKGTLPLELIRMARGLVYEELAELPTRHPAKFAAQAINDLSVNTWFRDLEPARWARLQQMLERERESGTPS